MTRAVLRSVAQALACYAVYLLWSGSLSVSELATGAAVAVAMAGWAAMLRRVSKRRYALAPADLRPVGRAAASLPAASARTIVALCRRRVPVRADERDFHRGGEDDPRARARRAAGLFAASLTPESFVLRAEPGRDRILLHGIGTTPPDGPA